MIVEVPASEACHMDLLNRYIKGMFDKNEEDLPPWEEVERTTAERTQVLSNLLCVSGLMWSLLTSICLAAAVFFGLIEYIPNKPEAPNPC